VKPHNCSIDGWALWAPSLPGWEAAAPALRGGALPAAALGRPAPLLLAANERRRAPDSVLVAIEVANAALAASGRAASDVATVFASTHGDLPITDALCKTLAADPRLLSPTRFHHSVHNAASGYWAIGSGSRAASTALAAGSHSFATGLLEAATQVATDGQPVMLVAYDTEATGALQSVNASRGLLAMALLLAPEPAGAASWRLRWSTGPGAVAVPTARSAAAQALTANASAAALPLFEALAAGLPAQLHWPLSATIALTVALEGPTSAGHNLRAASS
jgi:hypothetical protein